MSRVVVVGGGLAGAATAARLAKLGHQVTVVERRNVLGGELGFLEQDGFRWDTGPTATTMPAVLRDLFRKSGRPLERELELVPVEPLREHRFADGSVLSLPSGRSGQLESVDAALGEGLGRSWVDWVHGHAESWDQLRRGVFERAAADEGGAVDAATLELLRSRATMAKTVGRGLGDERLRQVALYPSLLDGHDPRNVPAWMGLVSYLEQNFGLWTVPAGMGRLAEALTKRLAERSVAVLLETTARDLVVRQGRVTAVATDRGTVEADVVVCAVDPRGLPALADLVRRSMPAIPPVVCHLGLEGDVPDLPHEVVVHGDPMLVVRTSGVDQTARAGSAAWTVLGRGRLAEDVVTALARAGIDVRPQVVVRVDRSPLDQVRDGGGSPYGVLWQGRGTLRHKLGTTTPLRDVYCVGAHATLNAAVPFVGLTAAVVAEHIGPAA